MPSLVSKRGTARTVCCTHCSQTVDVAQRAMSVVCPHCSKRLIVEDYRVTGYYGVREFSTCGDIVVEKNGTVSARIKVGTLVVRGSVQGEVHARHGVRIEKNGHLKGEIHAPAMVVEPGGTFSGFVRIGPV